MVNALPGSSSTVRSSDDGCEFDTKDSLTLPELSKPELDDVLGFMALPELSRLSENKRLPDDNSLPELERLPGLPLRDML